MTEPILPYHTPDSTWEIFGGATFPEYCERYVAKGKFHSNVPEDITKSYTVVEYIMAHSYYHYPMYDEAITKILLIFEMAIKQRCSQLGVELKTSKNKYHKLQYLINQLCKKESSKNILDVLEWIRERRNSSMHPNSMNFGLAQASNIPPMSVALINKIFHNTDTWDEIMLTHQFLIAEITNKLSGLLILTTSNKRYLIANVKLFETVKVNGAWIHSVVAYPVMTNIIEQSQQGKISLPISLLLTNLNVENNRLTADNYNSNESVILEETNDATNLKMNERYKIDFSSLNDTQKQGVDFVYETFVRRNVNHFLYTFYPQMV